jgi:hypothetical protein
MALRDRPQTEANIEAEAENPVQRQLTDAGAHLDRFEAVFGADRVGVFFFDDITARPAAMLDEICVFIWAVPAPLAPEVLQSQVNKGRGSDVPQALRRRLYALLSPVYAALERRFPGRVAGWRALYE